MFASARAFDCCVRVRERERGVKRLSLFGSNGGRKRESELAWEKQCLRKEVFICIRNKSREGEGKM